MVSSMGAILMPWRSEHERVELDVVADLENGLVLEHGLQQRKRLGQRHLIDAARRRRSRSCRPLLGGPRGRSRRGPARPRARSRRDRSSCSRAPSSRCRRRSGRPRGRGRSISRAPRASSPSRIWRGRTGPWRGATTRWRHRRRAYRRPDARQSVLAHRCLRQPSSGSQRRLARPAARAARSPPAQLRASRQFVWSAC